MINFISKAISCGYKPYFNKNLPALTEDELQIEYDIAQHFLDEYPNYCE